MFAMFANHSVCMHDIFRNRKILEFTISRYTIFANKEKHSWTVHAFYTFPNTEQFWQIKNLKLVSKQVLFIFYLDQCDGFDADSDPFFV